MDEESEIAEKMDIISPVDRETSELDRKANVSRANLARSHRPLSCYLS